MIHDPGAVERRAGEDALEHGGERGGAAGVHAVGAHPVRRGGRGGGGDGDSPRASSSWASHHLAPERDRGDAGHGEDDDAGDEDEELEAQRHGVPSSGRGGRGTPAKEWHSVQAFACAWAGACSWQRRQLAGSAVQVCAGWQSRHREWPASPCSPAPAVAFASWQLVQARSVSPRARAAGGDRAGIAIGAPCSFTGAWMPCAVWQQRRRSRRVAGRARRRGTRGRRSSASPPCRGRARRGRGGSRRSAPRSARSRACSRRGSARTRSCAPRSGSGARASRPPAASGVVREVALRAGADLDAAVPRGRLPEEERAEHRDALVRPRVVAALARDGLVRAAHPERELRARLVAGRAEARILVHVALEAPSAGEGSRDGQRGEGEHQRLRGASELHGRRDSSSPRASAARRRARKRGGRTVARAAPVSRRCRGASTSCRRPSARTPADARCFIISTLIRPFSQAQFIGKIEGFRCTL